jgi:hypothetical protein
MQDSLWFAGGSARVEKVKRVLAIERSRRAVCIHILQFPMPPNIAPFLHVDVICGATKNNHTPNRTTVTECVIDIFL